MSIDDIRPRATRYEFGAVILFRVDGEPSWREGWTVNVSRTGVLFLADEPRLDIQAPVEMIVVLPNFGSGTMARIRCTGHIVRIGDKSGRVSMAATIEHYRFLKPEELVSVDPALSETKR